MQRGAIVAAVVYIAKTIINLLTVVLLVLGATVVRARHTWLYTALLLASLVLPFVGVLLLSSLLVWILNREHLQPTGATP
ncbi:MAG: hypothetical protein HY556_03560 [Euryarchaeota archaeon]|nr:hypothetical protein [Euryarchaeota archaeon]